MAEIQQFIGEDGRKPIERLRRFQLWREADARGLRYPNGATKQAMIQIFEANNIDISQFETVKFQVVNGTDSAGRPNQEVYPVVPPHASARNGVDANAALNERLTKKQEEEKKFEEARLDALERENAQLRRDNEQKDALIEQKNNIINERLDALEGKKKMVKPETPQSKYWALYRKAKEMGKPVQSGMKTAELKRLIGE